MPQQFSVGKTKLIKHIHVSAKPSALAEGIMLLQKIKLRVINNTHY